MSNTPLKDNTCCRCNEDCHEIRLRLERALSRFERAELPEEPGGPNSFEEEADYISAHFAYAKALRAHAARMTVERDEAKERLKAFGNYAPATHEEIVKFYEWPGGLDEIESALDWWRNHAEENGQAADACRDVFKDFSGKEVAGYPMSIRRVWALGYAFDAAARMHEAMLAAGEK